MAERKVATVLLIWVSIITTIFVGFFWALGLIGVVGVLMLLLAMFFMIGSYILAMKVNRKRRLKNNE